MGPVLDPTDQLIYDNKEISNLFNDYFSTVFTTEETTILSDPVQFIGYDFPLDSIFFSEADVGKLLENLKTNKAPGANKIHPALLQIFHKELSKSIYIIFKKSLQEVKVSLNWRIANISPIYKKGNRKEVSNHRSVSLTSVIVKILERIII